MSNSNADLLADIMSYESLEELAIYLQSQSDPSIRNRLFELFDVHIEYNDADQWATAVRICEALAIIGWSSRERVDAISRFNGDCWETRFVTDKNQSRFREGRWHKRKSGWALFHPEYHVSPDRPDRPAVDWHQFEAVEFPIVDRPKLPSQRNYRKQMPIITGQIGGLNETSEAAATLNRELTRHLLDAMRPAHYGDALERFYFMLRCPTESESISAHLNVGTYNATQKAFYCGLHFDVAFANLSSRQQREYFASNLLAAIDALQSKLKKQKITYDIESFRSDVNCAIERWHAQSSD